MAADQLIPLPVVEDLSGLKKTKIYGMIKKGLFPTQADIPDCRRALWSRRAVDAWVAARVAA